MDLCWWICVVELFAGVVSGYVCCCEVVEVEGGWWE